MRNVMKLEVTFAMGYMYFGTYTFLISSPLWTMEPMAILVDSLKKLKMT